MIEKLRHYLLYITYGMIVCCVAIGGFLLRNEGIFYPIAAVVVIAAIVCYLFYTIRHCRICGIDLSTRFTGNMYFSIIMLLMCIAAYSEDRQEETWWPLVVMTTWCCTVDLVRCLLNEFCKTAAANAPTAETKATAPNEDAPKQGITMRCATRYCLLLDLYGWATGLATIIIILAFEGFTAENITDKLGFTMAFIVFSLFVHFDKCVTINGNRLKVVERTYYNNVCHLTMSDIDYVDIKRTVCGRRMTFHHGNNRKVTVYPADADKIVKRLKLYNVDVREADGK